jgi:hypothetical protein
MNWYKEASLIDNVQTVSQTAGSLVIMIGPKRYEYTGVPAEHLASEIARWKQWKNKHEAGKRVSALLKSLQPYLWKEPNPHQPTPSKNPQQSQQKGLFDV